MLQLRQPSRPHKRGFTLIELLVVIAIIAILAAILFPVFAKARENARRTSCMSNMKQIGLGVMQYSQDYDETYPYGGGDWGGGPTNNEPGINFALLMQPYLKSQQIFACPDDKIANGAAYSRSAGPGTPPATFIRSSYYWHYSFYHNFTACNPGAPGGQSIAAVNTPATKHMLSCSMSDNGSVGTPPHGVNSVLLLYADGHVKYTPFSSLVPSCAYGPYNFDWTNNGVGGTDIK